MDWAKLLNDNISQLLIGLFTILGAGIGLCSEIIREQLSRKSEFQKIQAEWTKEYLETQISNPVRQYIDDVLVLMNKYFTQNTIDDELTDYEREIERERMIDGGISNWESRAIRLRDEQEELQRREGLVRARVNALGDNEIAELFDKFSNSFSQFLANLSKSDSDSYGRMKDTWLIAGKIFNLLQPNISQSYQINRNFKHKEDK